MDTADIGRTVLILAFLVSVSSIALLIVGGRLAAHRWITIARNFVVATATLHTISLAVLVFAFATRDFSLNIVAEHVSRDLPVAYTLSALYADKAGSMLLWGWLISLFAAVLASQKHSFGERVLAYALSILAATQAFFLAMVTLVANVFEKNPAPPADGFGLNPLLQNVAMLVHPPMLYISFAAVSVIFALVIAALITRASSSRWIEWVRRWALFAWCTLGLGNLIGMWWSYNELGWGGYWAWDPVENAGLMPWLLITAFVHSISMRRQRNYLQTWSLVLAILTFVFTLLIPFITHGGIESPLHGFYGSNFPPYILAVILVAFGGSLGLLFFRHKGFQKEDRPSSLASREGAFLITNIILLILVFVILTGTVLPRLVELFGGSKIAVDRGFYDRIAGPIMLLLVFIMGVCPLLGWSRSSWQSARRNFLYTFSITVVIALAILISGIGKWYSVVAIICGFPLFTIFQEWLRGTRARHHTRRENYARAYLSLLGSNRARYGGFLVHIGIIFIALGIVASSFYNTESTVTLDIDESMKVGEYNLTYSELVLKESRARVSAVAYVSVTRNGRFLRSMYPQNDFWFSQMDSFSEVAVHTTPAEDLFVSLVWTSFDPSDKSVTIRALVNPLVVWIWIGGGFLLLGGAIAFSPNYGKLPGAQV